MIQVKQLCVGVLLVMFLFNCGGDKKKDTPKQQLKLSSGTEDKKVDSNVTNLVISGNDALQFDKKELRAKAGQSVKLTLRHTGKMNAKIMGHNIVILKQGVNLSSFGNRAASASDNNYIPKNAENEVIAYTKLIGGGQTTSIEFDAPAVGVYDFLCSFPGHYALMKGKFIVE